jgi:hypothetical protein
MKIRRCPEHRVHRSCLFGFSNMLTVRPIGDSGEYLADDDIQLAVISDLTRNHQELKRVAIPESESSWTIFLTDAQNVSEIIVYQPKESHIYERFWQIEEASASGIQFKITLVDPPEDLPNNAHRASSASDNENMVLHDQLRHACADIRGHINMCSHTDPGKSRQIKTLEDPLQRVYKE